MTSLQQTAALFKPIKVGRMTLQHRVALAPLTRYRAYASHIPGPQQASYYAQRASTPGTLLVTEATFISHDAGGFANVPGIYTDEQIQGWKKVRAICICTPAADPSKHCLVATLLDYGCCSRQRIVHLPPALGAGTRCRNRISREAGSTLAIRVRVGCHPNGQGKTTSFAN
jgi:hypothetical protein